MATPEALSSTVIFFVAPLSLVYLLCRLTVIRFSCRDLNEYDLSDGHDRAEQRERLWYPLPGERPDAELRENSGCISKALCLKIDENSPETCGEWCPGHLRSPHTKILLRNPRPFKT